MTSVEINHEHVKIESITSGTCSVLEVIGDLCTQCVSDLTDLFLIDHELQSSTDQGLSNLQLSDIHIQFKFDKLQICKPLLIWSCTHSSVSCSNSGLPQQNGVITETAPIGCSSGTIKASQYSLF